MVAIALCRDLVNDPIMTEETLKDPVIRLLAKKVTTKAERQCKPGDLTIEIRLEMAGGKHHALLATTFPGSPETPLDYDGVAEKFRRFTSRLLPAARADAIVNLVARVDQVKDMAEIGALIRPA